MALNPFCDETLHLLSLYSFPFKSKMNNNDMYILNVYNYAIEVMMSHKLPHQISALVHLLLTIFAKVANMHHIIHIKSIGL